MGLALSQIRVSYLEQILQMMNNLHNETVDFRKPHIRNSLRYVFPLFMFLHVIVAMAGISSNIYMIKEIFGGGFYKNPTFMLIANLGLSDLIKCILVLPITLAHLLIQNWLFGSFLCIFLPMLQYFPVHASMLTFLTIGIDRYRYILYPIKTRIPVILCIIGLWVLSVCIVLPYAIYVIYIDLESLLGHQFKGVGLCVKNIDRNTKEYLRAIFILVYVMPLAIIAFLFLRVAGDLKSKDSVQKENIILNNDRYPNSLSSIAKESEKYIKHNSSLPINKDQDKIHNCIEEQFKNFSLSDLNYFSQDTITDEFHFNIAPINECLSRNVETTLANLKPILNLNDPTRKSYFDSCSTKSDIRHNSDAYLIKKSIMSNLSRDSQESIIIDKERLFQKYLVATYI
ncbi:unnamed protein product [Gordionus sp. m RMFG-2023]